MSNLTLWSTPAWGTLVRRPNAFAELDNWLRDVFGPQDPYIAGFSPAAEVTRDGDDAVVRLELPGIEVEKDVTVELQNGRLVVHGERRNEHTEEANGHTLREFRYGSFRKSFAVPSHVDSEAITASYDAGVLTVRVAGAYQDRSVDGAKRIPITK